jgi:hypothetical protein
VSTSRSTAAADAGTSGTNAGAASSSTSPRRCKRSGLGRQRPCAQAILRRYQSAGGRPPSSTSTRGARHTRVVDPAYGLTWPVWRTGLATPLSVHSSHAALEPPNPDTEVSTVARPARLSVPDGRISPLPRPSCGGAHLHPRRRASGSQECRADGPRRRGREQADGDAPAPTLANSDLMRSVPDTVEPFFRVPKVLGEGEGA